ncbi:MAG: hypothetical protein WBN09_03660 [Woeseiaceae bacterium]
MKPVAWCLAILLVAVSAPAVCGDIPGIAPKSPSAPDPNFELTFSNDFLGRGGSVDDFRTQQIILNAAISARWRAVLDHSILTFSDEIDAARVDQMAISLGYALIRRQHNRRHVSVDVGAGLRSAGAFSGEQMQNGFHRLIGSDIETMPYDDQRGTDVTAWLDATHRAIVWSAGEGRLLGKWDRGYWLRGTTLLTSGGQWDSTAQALLLASRQSLGIWLGVRHDWREGYDDAILSETASEEDDTGLVVGVRFGALILETVQQLNNGASFGQLRLVAGGGREYSDPLLDGRLGVGFEFSLPDVQVRMTARYRTHDAARSTSAWRRSVLVAASYGEPQYRQDNAVFVSSSQFDVGLEVERRWAALPGRPAFYATLAGGWRDEQLIIVRPDGDSKLPGSGTAAVSLASGLRWDTSGQSDSWRMGIQCGLLATLPLNSAEQEVSGKSYELQRAALNLTLGFVVGFR